MNIHELRDGVEHVIIKAGEYITANKFTSIEEKGDVANIVTDMDIKVQRFLIDELKNLLPESSFLAEEEGVHEVGNDYVWIIDPIDGTTNYAYDFKHSAISIALIYRHEALLGMVYDPYLKELFYAMEGEGAYVNGNKLNVSDHALCQSLVICGTCPYEKQYADVTFSIMKTLFLKGRDVRRSGSAVLDLCYLAAGRCDCFYEHYLSPWDYAAGCLIIKEAGGIIKPIHGSLNHTQRIGICAGNKNNIKELTQLVLQNV